MNELRKNKRKYFPIRTTHKRRGFFGCFVALLFMLIIAIKKTFKLLSVLLFCAILCHAFDEKREEDEQPRNESVVLGFL